MYPTSNLEVATVVPLFFKNEEVDRVEILDLVVEEERLLVRSVKTQAEYTLIYMSARPRSLRCGNVTRMFVEGWYKPLPRAEQDGVSQVAQSYIGPYFMWVSA